MSLDSLPFLLLEKIVTRYLSLSDIRSLRVVSHALRAQVDIHCYFNVPLNNTSLRWVKNCVPCIDEVVVGVLTNSQDFLQWPDSWFPEVKTLCFKAWTCASSTDDGGNTVRKLFSVFPNVRNLTLSSLTGKEIMEILELKLDRESEIMHRNKIMTLITLVTPQNWNAITNLVIILTRILDSHSEVFGLLVKRTYPSLTRLVLEYRLQGYFNGNYDQLHPIYIYWVQFVANHYKTLKNLTLKHDLGLDLDSTLLLENPQDNLDLLELESPRSLKLTNQLEMINLNEISLQPLIHEIISNKAWNWNTKIVESQNSLVHLCIDCNDCCNWRDPEILQHIVEKSKLTLRTIEYKASSDNQGIVNNVIQFDLSMFKDCQRLESLELSRGWSRRYIQRGPSLIFSNVEMIPSKNLTKLKLRTESGKLKALDALWISKNLKSLEELVLPTCMKKNLVTSLLKLPKLSKFTLVRDYFSEIKLREMVQFCESTEGLSHYCPDIQCYDPNGRWLELLTIQVKVDRRIFSLNDDLIQRFPGVLISSN